MKINFINIFLSKREILLQTIMRIFLFLCFTTAFSFTPSNTFSQNAKIKIDTDRRISVPQIFKIIQQQAGFKFIYSDDLIENAPMVTLKKGVILAKNLLTKGLSPIGCTFEFTKDETIIVKKKLITNTVNNQQKSITVSGIITNEHGSPLAGVTVSVKGKFKGVTTDLDGKYSIKVEEGGSLVFSHLGYQTFEVVVYNKDGKGLMNFNFSLKEESFNLDEVNIPVVRTGYQRIKKERSVGSVESVNKVALLNNTYSNLNDRLVGLLPGLSITPNQAEEGKKTITVRGLSTLRANSSPLIVVDGFPIEGDINSINPYEIEDITLLKDAVASSIYGARSSNGVIIITTKKGKKGEPKVSYFTNLKMYSKPDLSYRLNRLDSEPYVNFLEKSINVVGFFEDPSFLTAPVNKVYETMFFAQLPTSDPRSITQNEANQILSNLKGNNNLEQIESAFLRNKIEKQHNFTISGGGEKHTYRTSLNYTNTEGEILNDRDNQIRFDFVNDIKFNSKVNLALGGNINIINKKSNIIDMERIYNLAPYDLLQDTNGNPLASPLAFEGKTRAEIERLKSIGLLDETFYPLIEAKNKNSKAKEFSARLQGNLTVKLVKGLTGELGFQYETGSGKINQITSESSLEVAQVVNNTAPFGYSGDPTGLRVPFGAIVDENRFDRQSYTLRGQLNFNRTFNYHNVTLLGGYEVREVFNSASRIKRYGFDENSLLYTPVRDADALAEGADSESVDGFFALETRLVGEQFTKKTDRFLSAYGNASYSFKDKYIVSGTVRLDKSNLFGTDPRFRNKPLWSSGVKWRASEESFFKSKVIDELSIRASYGINGNIANLVGPFTILQRQINQFGLFGNSIFSPRVNDLRWEKTTTKNLGVDIILLNNKVELNFDIYNRLSEDVLAFQRLDPTLGILTVTNNNSNIENKGFEISLKTTNITTNDFTWTSNLNYRKNTNKVLDVFTNNTLSSKYGTNATVPGFPNNALFTFQWGGLDNEGDPNIITKDGSTIKFPGIFTADAADDFVYSGTLDPIYSASLMNSFYYKNFNLSFLLNYNGGHVLLIDSFNGKREFLGLTTSIIHSEVENAWQNPGDENSTDVARIDSNNNFNLISSNKVTSGDYIKLREISLRYQIPVKSIDWLDNASINIQGNNLLYWAKNKQGIDPEGHGIGQRYFPTAKQFLLGVKLEF